MEEYLKDMIKMVNNSDELYLNCYMPMNRHLIRRPMLVKVGEQLFIGNTANNVLINVSKVEDIKVTEKENYGGKIL